MTTARSHFDDVQANAYLLDDFAAAAGWSFTAGAWAVENPTAPAYSGEHTSGAISLWNQTVAAGRAESTPLSRNHKSQIVIPPYVI